MDALNFYNSIGTEFSAALTVFNILLSFALQLIVLWIYKRTHRGLSYSQSFLFTLVIIGVLGTVIMMVVQNNLIGAFALLGAFSLIRFRTIVKETRDVAFVFFSLALGVAVGTSNYSIAIISAILITAIIHFMWKFGWGVSQKSDGLGFVITMTTDKPLNVEHVISEISKFGTDEEVLHAKYSTERGGHYAFSAHLRSYEVLEPLRSELQKQSGVNNLEFITTRHTVEY